MPLAAIISLIAKFIPDAEQREKAIAATRAAYANFLMATSSPLYAGLRSLIILLALWDAFLNGGRAWAETSRNLLANGPAGAVEMMVIAWLFVGEEVVKPMASALAQMVSAAAARGKSQDGQAPVASEPARPSVFPESTERPGRSRDG